MTEIIFVPNVFVGEQINSRMDEAMNNFFQKTYSQREMISLTALMLFGMGVTVLLYSTMMYVFIGPVIVLAGLCLLNRIFEKQAKSGDSDGEARLEELASAYRFLIWLILLITVISLLSLGFVVITTPGSRFGG